MKIINSDIKNKEFKNIYLLYGEEGYLRRYYKNRLVEAIASGDTMNVAIYDENNMDVSQMIDFALTMPFFAEYRLVVINESNIFSETKGGKAQKEELAEFFTNVPESTIFVISEQKVDKRSKLFKTVSKVGYACELKPMENASLQKWIAQALAKDKKKITGNDADYLIGRVGNDMELLSNEIEKLVCYIGERDVVTAEDIENVCTKTIPADIFKLVDSISAKDVKSAMKCYNDLISNGEPPQRILYMIIRQFNLMLQAKDLVAKGTPIQELPSMMGEAPFVAKKSAAQAKAFKMSELKNDFRYCVDTEKKIKSGRINEQIGLEDIIVRCCM